MEGVTGVYVVNKYQKLGVGSILLRAEFIRLNPHRKTKRLGQMTTAGKRKFGEKILPPALQDASCARTSPFRNMFTKLNG
jgi:hypothetical protein